MRMKLWQVTNKNGEQFFIVADTLEHAKSKYEAHNLDKRLSHFPVIKVEFIGDCII